MARQAQQRDGARDGACARNTPVVLTLGECFIDLVAADVGSLTAATTFVRAAGGAPANVAVGVARQGVRSGFIGAFSRDPFGTYLRDLLEAEGVDCAQAQCVDAPTALAFVSRDASGERDFLFYRERVADLLLDPAALDPEVIAGATVLHLGSLTLLGESSRAAEEHAVRIAGAAGVAVSYDPNLRPDLWPDMGVMRAAALALMPTATIVKMNEPELALLSGTSDLTHGIATLAATGPPIVIVTRGRAGCRYVWHGRMGSAPGFAVPAFDTTGAGDGFTAGLLVALTPRLMAGGATALAEMTAAEIDDALAWANATAALTTIAHGAIPAMPRRDAVTRFLAEATQGS
jgi:fructokinase